MFTTGIKTGTIRFSLRLSGNPRQVSVAGSFNQWTAVPMRRQRDGSYAATVAVPSGEHQYKFVVDGQWMTDPDNVACALNPYGTVNSVAKAA